MTLYDQRINKLFNYWILLNLTLILIMIIVGGLTRLTDSGLSITKWELFSGILPPFNNSTWEAYFNLYKQIPQYEIINPTMTLNEFKVIFFWEYIHRMLGRIIGLCFVLPLLYFHLKKKIKFRYLRPYYIVAFLIILQGIVGWYMVKSGLVNDVTVSHYRLSLHLFLAVAIISVLFWQYKNFLNKSVKSFFYFSKKNIPYQLLIYIIFFQIIFGAFVSGLDAGKIYQTWPLMGLNYIPNDLIINNFFDLYDFNNHSLVQFYHRNIAYVITIYIFILGFYIFKKNEKKLFSSLYILFFFLISQVSLGIFSLLSNLNIYIASGHQIISVILVLSALNLYYSAIK